MHSHKPREYGIYQISGAPISIEGNMAKLTYEANFPNLNISQWTNELEFLSFENQSSLFAQLLQDIMLYFVSTSAHDIK